MAITFSSNGLINQAHDAVLAVSNACVGVWWRRNGRPSGTQMEIYSKHSSVGSFEGFGFYLENTAGAHQDTLNVYSKDIGGGIKVALQHLNQVAFDGNWHLASANLQTANAAVSDLYMDGLGKVSANSPAGAWDLGGASNPIRLAKSIDTFWQGFDGSLAHAFYYNEILTDAEHLALASGVSPLFIRPHALLFYLPMNGPDFIQNAVDCIPTSSALTTSGTLSPTAFEPPISPDAYGNIQY